MVYSGFFDGEFEYGQEEFNRYFANLYESGVSMNDAGEMTLKVTAGNGSVIVAPGFAIVNGFYLYNDNELELAVTPNTNYNRIDRVVCRVKPMAGNAEIAVIKGIAASVPEVPGLTRNEVTYEISLAKVMVSTNGIKNIVDERADVSVCGAIRPKNLTEYRTMVAAFKKQWEEWFAVQQGTGWRNIYIQSSEPGEAVAGSIWIKTNV